MPAPKKIAKKLEGGGRGSLSTGGASKPPKNYTGSRAKAIDKAVKNTVKNKGKASEVVKNLRQVREDIESLSKVRGSRTSNSSDKRKIYRGSQG